MIWKNTIWDFLKKEQGSISSKLTHFIKLLEKQLILLIVHFSHIYAFISTFWIVIGCKGPEILVEMVG